MAARASPLRSATDPAGLALHEHGLRPTEVVAQLLELVERLGLGEDVAFERGPVGDAADVGELVITLRLPRGDTGRGPAPVECSGGLRCRPVDDEAARWGEVLAAHAQIALEDIGRVNDVARREEAVRRVAEQLQDSLLPDLPSVPRTRLAVAYRAAAREARVGGDFYDAFPLPDGRVLTVVGDVMGKGVRAASRTTQITQTLGALALQGSRSTCSWSGSTSRSARPSSRLAAAP